MGEKTSTCSDSPIIVTGVGRCGTSLTMAMLEAGGFPVAGSLPLYEQPINDFITSGLCLTDKQLNAKFDPKDGTAYKVVIPFLQHLDARRSFRFIFCLRDPMQQALSQSKFSRIFFGNEVTPEGLKAAIEQNMELTRWGIKHCQEWPGSSSMCRTFEQMISEPMRYACELDSFAGCRLDLKAMRAVVRDRPVECSSDIELQAKPT